MLLYNMLNVWPQRILCTKLCYGAAINPVLLNGFSGYGLFEFVEDLEDIRPILPVIRTEERRPRHLYISHCNIGWCLVFLTKDSDDLIEMD